MNATHLSLILNTVDDPYQSGLTLCKLLWIKTKSVSTEINGMHLSVILNAAGDAIQSGLTLCICE